MAHIDFIKADELPHLGRVLRDAISASKFAEAKFRRLWRFAATSIEARWPSRERELEDYVNGAGFTDSVEREIERRALADPWAPL
jgi:hypothetical protein